MNEASAFEVDALDSSIRELVVYARERSGEDRSTLFRNLVDLFLTGKAPQNDPTRGQLLDVMQALVPHVDAEARRTACDLIANMSKPPIDLVIRLAQDRATITTNLLTKVDFDELDLIELIEKTGREHHQLIAGREDLSANIWIALARAAPSALPFDHNSTLALWNEDLGITQTKAPSKDKPDDTDAGNSEPRSATVTPLRPERGKVTKKDTDGSIRILRTDQDLAASLATVRDVPADALEKRDEKGADDNTAITEVTATPLPENVNDIALIAKNAMDPGPGGWSWISDRDGLIKSVSPQGLAILGTEVSSPRTSMLDLLGLNAKLGHPVARAFQRRSAIHDAPIFLHDLEEKNRHWTLEATPFFSSPGGIFEGYEGILTPVVSANEDTEEFALDDNSTALFLDDVAPSTNSKKTPRRTGRAPEPFIDKASVFQAGILGPDPDEPTATDYSRAIGVIKPTQQALDDIAFDINNETTIDSTAETASKQTATAPKEPTKTDDELNSTTQDKLSEAAAKVVKEVLAEALAPLEASIGDALDARPHATPTENDTGAATTSTDARPNDTKAPKALPKEEPVALTSTEVTRHIIATFDLLETALGRLTEASKASEDPQARLQGEIASACVKSLKEHLK